jgi:hypothetical protein
MPIRGCGLPSWWWESRISRDDKTISWTKHWRRPGYLSGLEINSTLPVTCNGRPPADWPGKVRIPLHVTNIDDLIHLGLLRQDERQDEEAVRAAVLRLVHQALDGARDEWVPHWARAE